MGRRAWRLVFVLASALSICAAPASGAQQGQQGSPAEPDPAYVIGPGEIELLVERTVALLDALE